MFLPLLTKGAPVTEACREPFKFTGKIAKVTIDPKEMMTADQEKAKKAHMESVLKKALSD